MKKIIITCGILGLLQLTLINCNAKTEVKQESNSSENNLSKKDSISTIYSFEVTDIDGKPFKMDSLKGKKIMIVNTASKCGNTPQYADLEKLYNTYKDKNFVILGFPANDFLGQEPGSNEEIKKFCTANFNVSFPMMSKISVKGDEIAPIYKWLTKKSENGVMDSEVEWNFQKYLIDENGKLVDVVPPKESILSDKVKNWIENKK
ncbi:glutathione peroxidase [Apibacter muscae]|uniref:Glutathione peroxidase n=1 Tax=Apibacter muscae TaxID=2509004 RepID=A0A563D7Q6_9FLAO|nr:glutathione peroxidase [Apibacter muscae]TWP26127.1 glutathione peroxidase [Apibacter muscae]TWP27969.1 glutathione peroxidase [Apibacter muscae]